MKRRASPQTERTGGWHVPGHNGAVFVPLSGIPLKAGFLRSGRNGTTAVIELARHLITENRANCLDSHSAGNYAETAAFGGTRRCCLMSLLTKRRDPAPRSGSDWGGMMPRVGGGDPFGAAWRQEI